jgi:hypothetical protein
MNNENEVSKNYCVWPGLCLQLGTRAEEEFVEANKPAAISFFFASDKYKLQ